MDRSGIFGLKWNSRLSSGSGRFAILTLFLLGVTITYAQEADHFAGFGFHSGFHFEGDQLDKCKTYYDSNAHVLFNPCYDFRNKGIYSSYLARKVILGNCLACDSISVLLPHPVTDLDWKYLQENQKEAWDYYFRLWKQQDKIEKYHIDLEGVVRGALSGPF